MTSSDGARRRRGEPLAALALLLTCWTGVRMMVWESPFGSAFSPAVAAPTNMAGIEVPPGLTGLPFAGGLAALTPSAPMVQLHLAGRPPRKSGRTEPTMAPVLFDLRSSASGPEAQQPQSQAFGSGDSAAAFAVQPGIYLPSPREGRWHFDGWVAWRSGSGLPAVASGARPASYGGTQTGAVVRFDLAPGPHRPALHLRGTYAPDRPRQSEVAAGAGLRPLGRLPVRVMAEVRATRTRGQTEVRPAVLAVTELAPIALPLGLAAEGYAQAGWVGGRYATAFADGQARVTRAVATLGPARLRIGAGAWGGAQKFAERVDVGPTIALDLAGARVGARLSLDYRARVAGNATPGDGLALTLSTGF